MASERNPYDWQSHHPEIQVPRAAVDTVAEILADGGSAVVLGGRGMGKSVFLRQLNKTLEEDEEIRVLLIPVPPPELTVRTCLDQLAAYLKVAPGALNSQMVIDAYFARDDVPKRLVLLFDEFDRYAQKAEASGNPPGRGFFNDIEATRRDTPGLGVLATGSLGVFVVRDVLGSSFLSRAYNTHLAPFEQSEANALAQPFLDHKQPLSSPTRDALFLASGGIPALQTYGLQQLWRLERDPDERDVLDVFARFRSSHAEYLRDLLRSVADPKLSQAPQRILDKIRKAEAPLPRSDLEKALAPTDSLLNLDLIDVLRLLEAAGLVRIKGSLYTDNPLRAYPISSILDLPTESIEVDVLAERLRRDLETLMAKLHRGSADFFRPVRGQAKRLVPESVFAAHLALGLELLGWRVEREAQSAAGRTDLKLRRNGAPEVLVVEVKIWGRNDYREVQQQLESYWTENVSLGVAIQLTDAELPDWAEKYRRDCLEAFGIKCESEDPPTSTVRAHFRTLSSSSDVPMAIDHYLVALPCRP